jgi:hypothetical protein
MPTLEEKIQMLGGQNATRTNGQPNTQPEGEAQESWFFRAPAQFNVGLAQMLGLPKVGADLLRNFAGYEEESALPSGREIQQAMADAGMTYQPDEQPETVVDRFFQNVGASALPVGGMAAKGVRTAAPYVAEGLAAAGGAAGGKALESTTWGEDNPMMARALGELGGGLSASSATAAAKLPRAVLRYSPVGMAKAPFRGEWAKRRAAGRLAEAATDPEQAQRALRQSEFKQAGAGQTPVQRTDDRGIAQLSNRIQADIPEHAEAVTRQRSQTLRDLQGQAVDQSSGGLADVRGYLERRFTELAQEADSAMKNVREADHPVVYNQQARKKLDDAYKLARQEEAKVWSKLPEGEQVAPQSLVDVYKEEIGNITEGGDIGEIDQFVRQKLGRPNKKGQLVGGQLVHGKKETASAKALHQFYSRLGRRVRELSDSSGQTNKIRILNRLRQAALEDLDASEVGENYREAIRLSRDLNEKFTSGGIGRVLGFQRGQSTPETMTLEDLIGSGGQEAKESIQQALKAAPGAEDDVKNFIRTRFAMAAENAKNNKLNRQAGQKFLQKYKRVLESFPDLRSEMENAIQKQSSVDEFTGATDVTEMSPLVKERAATAVFLGADPGDELQRVIRQGASKGKTTDYLTDLTKQVRKDPTGKAKKGLKNALASELIESARKTGRESFEDPVTGESFISGRAFLKRLNDLEGSIKKSGLMDKDELKRLRKIGRAFRGIETELSAGKADKLITDSPGQALDLIAGLTGARIGGNLGASSAGGSLQWANIGSDRLKRFMQAITKDEARNLLIKATQDQQVMDDLLTDARKLSEKQQMSLLNRIVAEAKDLGSKVKSKVEQTQAPATAVTPPLVSAGQDAQEDLDKRRLEGKLEMLQ